LVVVQGDFAPQRKSVPGFQRLVEPEFLREFICIPGDAVCAADMKGVASLGRVKHGTVESK
jgi:hypothetical protein